MHRIGKESIQGAALTGRFVGVSVAVGCDHGVVLLSEDGRLWDKAYTTPLLRYGPQRLDVTQTLSSAGCQSSRERESCVGLEGKKNQTSGQDRCKKDTLLTGG